MKKQILSVIVCASLLASLSVSVSVAASQPPQPLVSMKEGSSFLAVRADVQFISEGMIGMIDTAKAKYGYMDRSGKTVISPCFYKAEPFSEGLAMAALSPNAAGYIDYSGAFIIPPVYRYGEAFREGKAIVYLSGGGCQLIDTKGKPLLAEDYESIMYEKACEQYIAVKSGKTDIFDSQLKLLRTYPCQISSVTEYKGELLAIVYTNDNRPAGVLNLTSGKMIDMDAKSSYVNLQNGMVVMGSAEGSHTKVYNLDGALLHEFQEKNVYPLTETALLFADIDSNDWYLRQSGKDTRVNYTILESIGAGLFTAYAPAASGSAGPAARSSAAKLETDGKAYAERMRYGIVNSEGKAVLPFVYDAIFINYSRSRYSYSHSVSDAGIFLALKENTCEVYDTSLKLIKAYENVTNGDISGEIAFINHENGMTSVLDADGKLMEELATGSHGISYARSGMLISEQDSGVVHYLYLNDENQQKGNDAYEPALAAIEQDTLAAPDESIFLSTRFQKLYKDGQAYWLDSWQAKPFIENGRAYIPPSLLSDAFSSLDWNINDDIEVFYQGKSLRMDFGSNEAELTYYDPSTRRPAMRTIQLDAAALRRTVALGDSRDILALEAEAAGSPGTADGKKLVIGDAARNKQVEVEFVPLRSALEALGLHIYWKDGLIGIANRPITLTDEQAAGTKAALESIRFGPESLVRLDASLAAQPYVDALVKQSLGVAESPGNLCGYTNTIPGYEALINGTKDILLATEPSKEMLALAASKGVELEVTPFAKEGFVFLVNQSNPVDTLSVQQLKDIYNGTITNWKQAGGPDAPVIAYQRNASSGSQTLMENVFMKDEKLIEPVTERRIESMEGLIDVIKEFTGEVNHSIRYSVYYYATQMYGSSQVKLIKADGVAPDSASIADGSYPIIVNYYIVTRKGDRSAAAAELKDYILSPEGQRLLEVVGLVPLQLPSSGAK